MASRPITIGTRGSRLALSQTDIIVAALREHHPNLDIEIKQIKTQGDRDRTSSLNVIGGQGVFVKEIEAALLSGEIDVAVHSLKDVPAEIGSGLVLAAFVERGDARDALVTREGLTLDELASGARIGTSSRRRAAQIKSLRPDVEALDIRGNVDTRIRKVDDGEYEGAVLAYAGLVRLGLAGRAAQVFEPDALIPSVGQGALAVEAREEDTELTGLLSSIDHTATRLACEAERAFMARLGGGCQLPFGAYAQIDDDGLTITGFVSDDDGERRVQGELRVALAEASTAGTKLAEQLLNEGAEEFMSAAKAS